MLIWALPAWLGWALARVTVLAPYRLGYGTVRVSGTAQGAGSEQKGVFLFRISAFLPFSEQNPRFCSDSAREGPSSRPVPRGRVQVRKKRELFAASSARGRLQFREERAPVPATALRQEPERRRGNLKMSGLNRIFMT